MCERTAELLRLYRYELDAMNRAYQAGQVATGNLALQAAKCYARQIAEGNP